MEVTGAARSTKRWFRRPAAALAAAVFVVAGAAAIAVAHDRGSRSPSSTAPLATVLPSTLPTTTQAPASVCTRAPITKVYDSYYGIADPHGPSLDYANPHTNLPARGIEGTQIRYVGQDIEIVRPNGTTLLPHSSVEALGDFDGDGRTDLLVSIDGGSPTSYLVLGTAAVGTHSPSEVGIGLPAPNTAPTHYLGPWWPVGDQNHDGAADVMIDQRLYSGRQLSAGRPGQRFASLPSPLRRVPYPVVGVLQLEQTAPPTIIEADSVDSVLLVDGRADRLTVLAGAHGVDWTITAAKGWLVNAHRIAQLSYSTRSGLTLWRWDLDAPCAGGA